MDENIEPKKEPVKDEVLAQERFIWLDRSKTYTPQEFAELYQILCDVAVHRLVVNPVWIARDDGTFSLQQQYSIGKLPKKEQ